jgi:hypothetical protein
MVWGWGVAWWLAMVPVVGGIMVYAVEVRGRNAKKIELKMIEPHLAQKSGGKQIENRSISSIILPIWGSRSLPIYCRKRRHWRKKVLFSHHYHCCY